ncbi:hypothetical protein SKAU_G00311830 [Synaphobranchus kaupii]|uniref:Uncharacterized protein n=1 Tax=Synaphobranchus kaupii TaxID=118154 RepID=A0A9Q1IJ78_SYNKA|nr:hypothetical protein SKAU_G00311830 [Synaphobranchus kaupii]
MKPRSEKTRAEDLKLPGGRRRADDDGRSFGESSGDVGADYTLSSETGKPRVTQYDADQEAGCSRLPEPRSARWPEAAEKAAMPFLTAPDKAPFQTAAAGAAKAASCPHLTCSPICGRTEAAIAPLCKSAGKVRGLRGPAASPSSGPAHPTSPPKKSPRIHRGGHARTASYHAALLSPPPVLSWHHWPVQMGAVAVHF